MPVPGRCLLDEVGVELSKKIPSSIPTRAGDGLMGGCDKLGNSSLEKPGWVYKRVFDDRWMNVTNVSGARYSCVDSMSSFLCLCLFIGVASGRKTQWRARTIARRSRGLWGPSYCRKKDVEQDQDSAAADFRDYCERGEV